MYARRAHVQYGATGFTGRQAAAYFAAHAPPGLPSAVAARYEARLHTAGLETTIAPLR